MISKEASNANLQKLEDPNRGRLVFELNSYDGESYRLIDGMGGRSVGSKNRYYDFVPDLNNGGEIVKTAVHDPELQVGNAAATLYTAIRGCGNLHVASNGEQTEGILISMALGTGFEAGQRLYKNERQQNGYTARITAALNRTLDFAYIGKITSIPENPDESTYEVWRPGIDASMSFNPGEGYFTSTYDGKGDLGPNYEPPWGVLLRGNLEDNLDEIWSRWDPNTRGNLVGKEINKKTGEVKYARRSIHEGRA